MPSRLYWLPEIENWREKIKQLNTLGAEGVESGIKLTKYNLDFLQTNHLDAYFKKIPKSVKETKIGSEVKLAILGPSTYTHLHSAIRVGGIRHGINIETYETAYNQFRQEILNPSSGLKSFAPNFIILSFDAYHIESYFNAYGNIEKASEAFYNEKKQLYKNINSNIDAKIIQQSVLNVLVPIVGNCDRNYEYSAYNFVNIANKIIQRICGEFEVDFIDFNARIYFEGLKNWHDTSLWMRSKQEIMPTSAPVYGDIVSNTIAIKRGNVSKCLVLDLDNTIWGGVIGDDGLDGIKIGQGNAISEGYFEFQKYVKNLAKRGIILAVCSKNDHANAIEPFEKHEGMLLKLEDIPCFMANWNDKATNIRNISKNLNIGLDSIVFVDDNPVERDLIRQELPMVNVPEFPDEPAMLPRLISDAGYFDSFSVTVDDLKRINQYNENSKRQKLLSAATDIAAYLKSLEMKMAYRDFDEEGFARIVQLINKTNQFNLTTKRYTENQMREVIDNGKCITIQAKLVDKFGDNGMIAAVIAKPISEDTLEIDTWLMSCRVLGRHVEDACLDLLVSKAINKGYKYLIGRYIATEKNSIVAELFPRLGFVKTENYSDSNNEYILNTENYLEKNKYILIERNNGVYHERN